MWYKNDWLCEGKNGFGPGSSCEIQVITVCHDIADSLYEISTDAIVIDVSKRLHFIPHDRLLTKLAASGVDSRVVVWGREFLVGRTESFRVRRQLSKEVTGISSAPQGSVLVPLPFLAYVNDIWRYVDSSIRLFAYESIIYR